MFHVLLPAVLALFPMLAGATPPRADDARAEVPETRYRAPAAYRPPERPATTPERHWAEANRSVLGYNPMMLTMPESPPAQAPGKQQAAPAPDHGAHAGHAKEGHH